MLMGTNGDKATGRKRGERFTKRRNRFDLNSWMTLAVRRYSGRSTMHESSCSTHLQALPSPMTSPITPHSFFSSSLSFPVGHGCARITYETKSPTPLIHVHQVWTATPYTNHIRRSRLMLRIIEIRSDVISMPVGVAHVS